MKTVQSATADQKFSHTSPSPSKAFKLLPDTLNNSTPAKERQASLEFPHLKRLPSLKGLKQR